MVLAQPPDVAGSLPQPRPAAPVRRQLPEHLPTVWTLTLLCADVFAALAAADVAGLPGAFAPAFGLVFCGTLTATGAYQRSYATHARDEIYHAAAAAALAAIPLWAVLHVIAGLSTVDAVAAIALAAGAIALFRYVLHCARHSGEEAPYGGVRCISPQAHWRAGRLESALWKRCSDVALASLALVLLSPIMIAAAVAISCESAGPIGFRQERVGLGGVRFGLFKFRTMRVAAGAVWASPGDRRITRVGAILRRYSIDELPQLFNVIRGEMSLLGPRPEMSEYATQFAATIPHYDERHVVRPGITGWSQVQLQRNLAPSDMPNVLPYDLFYVEYASPALDAVILLKTAAEFLFHRAV